MISRALSCLIAAVAFACVLIAISSPAQAVSSNADSSTTAKKQKSHSVKFVRNPNQETTAERERRLKRECRGMPNAGACLGYAD